MAAVAGGPLLLLLGLLGQAGGGAEGGRGWFADRPIAWYEHDDQPVAKTPDKTRFQEWDITLLLRDSLGNEMDRILGKAIGENKLPAADVNALDEVPCSTWFCPRNHLRPMSPAETAAGPPVRPPRLPLRIVKGKQQGATAGFEVLDADGQRFMLKLDPVGRVGLTTAPELIGQLLFHAAGYNVPGAFVLELEPGTDLLVDPQASFRLYNVEKLPLPPEQVQAMLSFAGRTPQGRLRAAVVPWIPGEILGGFDFIGRRRGDPNDRIPHQNRRSLRASWMLLAWLSYLDPSSINTLDSLVEADGRRFVRHYFIDFGASLGGASVGSKGPQQGTEYVIGVGRTIVSFAGLGFYQRPSQRKRDAWLGQVSHRPAVGWFEAEGFEPDEYRSNRKVPAHKRRTDADDYWGAKLVTAFTDAQIAAVVERGRLSPSDSAYVARALQVRRDIIGRRFLRAMTAVEQPQVVARGTAVCFTDLAIARGYATAAEVSYEVVVSDGRGERLAQLRKPAGGPQSCLPITGPYPGSGYRIVHVQAHLENGAGHSDEKVANAARIHLRWRASARQFVLVGLERDE